MLKISKKTEYALMILTSLASESAGEAVSLRKLSKRFGMPYKYVSQIAPLLVEAKILQSKEGVGGGYFLVKEPREINMVEVVELLEGPLAPVACMRGECSCEAYCGQKSVMEKMAEDIRKTMEDFTVADLIGE